VRRYERGTVVVDLGKCEALLPSREQAPTEKYPIGSRVRAFIIEVRDSAKALEVILSRTHPGFLKKLFELEVPEISDGIVEIKAVARESGFRSKVAVFSNSEKVDSVGACVGMRGERIKNIVRELNGERIDIVPWSNDQAVFVANALSPAKPKKVKLDDAKKRAEILVAADQLSLAIGRKGQNARLCAKLTGIRIDILSERMPEGGAVEEILPKGEVVFSAGDHGEEPVTGLLLNEIHGLEEGVLKGLRQTGYRTAQEVLRLPAVDLSKIVGLDEVQAKKVLDVISSALGMPGKEKEEKNEGS
jgi:N utilization substance protein A